VTKLTDKLRVRGWEFYYTGPNGGMWLLFDKTTDKLIARQGDIVWLYDIQEITKDDTKMALRGDLR